MQWFSPNIQPSIERRAPYGKCHFSQRLMEKCGLLLVPTIVQPWLRFHRYPCRKHQILPSSFWKPQCWIELTKVKGGFLCVDVFSKGSQRKTQEGNEWNNNWEVVVKKNGMVETCFLTYHKLYPRNVKNLGYSLRLLTQNTAKSRGKKKHQSVLTTKNHQPKTQTNPEDIQNIGPIELQLSQKRKGTSEAFKVWNH